jgi:hypothetical protein
MKPISVGMGPLKLFFERPNAAVMKWINKRNIRENEYNGKTTASLKQTKKTHSVVLPSQSLLE